MKNYFDVLHLLLSYAPIILFLVLLHLNEIQSSVGAVEAQLSNVTFPAMFVFGDSTVDPGNNNHILISPSKSNFPPYGRDFIGHKATGRFSNGKLVSDFVASTLGIKEILPAYFEPGLKTADLLTGVSFGSAATGFDNLTAQISLGIPIWEQLKYLDETLEKLKVEVGKEKVEQIISEALFFVSSGSVDYFAYFQIPIRRFQFNISEYTSFLVGISSQVVRELYRLGARKIIHVGVGPIGCVPFQRTLHGHPNRECDEDVNYACLRHNFQLMEEIDKLGEELHGSKIKYVDAYLVILDIILNFKKYGFEEESLGCCGTGYIEASILCNPFTLSTCKNASTFVFWDSVHPSERTNEMIANDVVRTIIANLG